MELIKVEIACDGLYTSTEQPLQYQKKVFEEIACGLTQVIFTTPKKFQMNAGFSDQCYKGCENLTTELQTKVSKEIIVIYHSELSTKQKSTTLLNWRSGKIRIMVTTNAFGMGINIPDIQNLIQESGCAGHDRLFAKAIIMYSRKDIRTIMEIYSNGQP
ncbi:8902_t:CDS:2, partial [Funneliformis geosporum]